MIALRIIAIFLFCLAARIDARAADNIETAGDILQFVLPATAGGLTLGYKDYKGTLQFGESAALTLGATYALKYSVDERRPNGGSGSFPRRTLRFPFRPLSSCASDTVGNMASRLTRRRLLSPTAEWRPGNIIPMM